MGEVNACRVRGRRPGDYSALDAALHAHLAEHGPGDWSSVRNRHPAVKERTFWRRVQKAQEAHAESQRQALFSDDVREAYARLRTASLMYDDAMLLRESAFDAEGAVRYPGKLSRSIELRRRALDFLLKLTRSISKLELGQIIQVTAEELLPEEPAVRHRVVQRMRSLHDAMRARAGERA